MTKMRLKLHLFSLTVASLVVGCSFDETPNDVHEKLVPKIVEGLLADGYSPLVEGITPEIIFALQKHAAEGITYKLGAPELGGETGMRFYSKSDHRQFLAIALYLNASKKRYTVGSVSVAPENEQSMPHR
jgi:hypothetical protein